MLASLVYDRARWRTIRSGKEACACEHQRREADGAADCGGNEQALGEVVYGCQVATGAHDAGECEKEEP